MVTVLLLTTLLQTAQNPGFVTGVVRANGQPAAGVRVYAMAVSPSTEPTAATAAPAALESQTQTDSNGRYRLEVPPGRYYIASGAVGAPTYFPGTTDVSQARIVSVTAGAFVPDIDFSSFVRAQSPGGGIQLPPGSTGVLSGTIRYPDGKPASNIVVAAYSPTTTSSVVPSILVPASPISALTATVLSFQQMVIRRSPLGPPRAITDSNGGFVIQNIPPDTYYLVAGFDDAPAFYPGVANIASARSITTTPTTNLSALDFVIPLESTGVTVSGRVTAAGGGPAIGASVVMTLQSTQGGLPTGLLAPRLRVIDVRSDGSFELVHVPAGTYKVEIRLAGITPKSQTLVVSNQPIRDLNVALPVALLSGRILMEDGSPVPDVQAFNEAMITTVGPAHPGIIMTTIFPISRDGSFSRVIEADEYRFTLRFLPQEYEIRSITAGSVDLLKDRLITGTDSVNIEVRVGYASLSPSEGRVRFSGVITNVSSGLPSRAERVTICCVSAGPAEGFSTKVRDDGSFEFSSVPPGDYFAGLKLKGEPTTVVTGSPNAPIELLTKPAIKIGNNGETGVVLQSSPGLTQVTAVVEGESTTNPQTRISFRASSNQALHAAVHAAGGIYNISLPRGDQYTVLVTPPPGYMVRTIGGQPVSLPFEIPVGASTPTIRIVVERTP